MLVHRAYPFAEGLVKNRYSGRTFIKPNQEERELAVRMKLNALPHIVGANGLSLSMTLSYAVLRVVLSLKC